MINPPEPESIDLKHVFQEFRIVILENYKKFIVDFMAHFKSKWEPEEENEKEDEK